MQIIPKLIYKQYNLNKSTLKNLLFWGGGGLTLNEYILKFIWANQKERLAKKILKIKVMKEWLYQIFKQI